MLYPCMLCVALLMCLFVLCVVYRLFGYLPDSLEVKPLESVVGMWC